MKEEESAYGRGDRQARSQARAVIMYYALNPAASSLADQLIVIMSLVMVGMSYQMPVAGGVSAVVREGSWQARFLQG